MELVNWLLIGR